MQQSAGWSLRLDTIAGRLQYARHLRGISQSELAARSGVTAACISRAERGITKPHTTTLTRLATVLKVDPVWLLFGIEERKPISYSGSG